MAINIDTCLCGQYYHLNVGGPKSLNHYSRSPRACDGRASDIQFPLNPAPNDMLPRHRYYESMNSIQVKPYGEPCPAKSASCNTAKGAASVEIIRSLIPDHASFKSFQPHAYGVLYQLL